ncbi:MAG: SRPBCC family protein [Candidatus Melainabacteria bacterium]|nr:SRPBCC family protein [Candidatus Melainabacteria bacterium]
MKKSITVQAGQQSVWKAILNYRASQPHRRRMVSQTENVTVMEESFTGLPMVGTSRLVYEEVEHPFEKITFKLVEGQHLSKFHGSWKLVPSADGRTCAVHIDAEFDTNLPVPFKENILNQLAEMDIGKRLAYVKQQAEADKD